MTAYDRAAFKAARRLNALRLTASRVCQITWQGVTQLRTLV